MLSAMPPDWQHAKSFPRNLFEKLLHALGVLGSLCLGFSILVCALFPPFSDEDALSESSASAGRIRGEPIYEIHINEKAQKVLVHSRHNLTVRDSQTGLLLNEFPEFQWSASSVCWLPGSQQFLLGGMDGSLRILDSRFANSELFAFPGHRNEIRSLAITRDGGTLVTGSQDRICRWDLHRRQVIAQMPTSAAPNIFSFSPDETRLLIAFADGNVQIVRTNDLKRERQFQKRVEMIVAAKFIQNGRQIIVGDISGKVTIHDLATGRICWRAHPCDLQLIHMAVSPDERFVVFSDWSKNVAVYSLGTLEKITCLPAESQGVSTLQFAEQSGWLYAAGYDGTVRIWDVPSFEELGCFLGTKPLD